MRSALVTGAAGGIGRCLVAELEARGFEVLACDLEGAGAPVGLGPDTPEPPGRVPPAQALPHDPAGTPGNGNLRNPLEARPLKPPSPAGPRIHPWALDVRSADQWQAAVAEALARWGRLDLLVNGAGVLRPGRVTELTPDDVDAHLQVNLRGVALGTRAVAPMMVAAGRGHIVNLASLAGLAAVPGLSLYSATKCAVRSFSLAAAAELRPAGVKVTVVCPDAVQTPMLDLQKGREEAALTFSGLRALAPQEVARAIAGPVLERAPLEYWMPAWRGWMARLADLAPEVGLRLEPWLRRWGRRRQAQSLRGRE